jgi:hypothetical protein
MMMSNKKYMPVFSVLIFTLTLATLISGCSKDYFAPVNISESDTLSYSADIQPIFTKSCLGSGCHSVNGGLQPFLESSISYESLLGGNYVDTLAPESSIIYARINASSNFMPPSAKLPPVEIQKILIWIKQGAQKN